MDDFTWQKKLQQRRTKQRLQLLGIISLFTILTGTFLWHFFYICTPEYALHELQSSFKSENSRSTIKRYVNLDLLTSQAYDDLTRDMFAYDTSLNPQTKVLFEKFYVYIKPQLTAGLTDSILDHNETGDWHIPDDDDILKGQQLGIDYDYFLERTQLRNTEIVKIGAIERSGRSATASIEVCDTYTQQHFTLILMMDQCEDDHWQISYIKNYREYLDCITPLHDTDLNQYIAQTKNIVNNYNDKFRQQQKKFQSLTKTSNGQFSTPQKESIQCFILQEVIPTLEARQNELDAVSFAGGAAYFVQLRQESTKLSIASWQHFASGISQGNQSDLETAESLHKDEMDIDHRIENIITHTAISKDSSTP